MTETREPHVIKQIIVNLLDDNTVTVHWANCSSVEYYGMLEVAKTMMPAPHKQEGR